MWRANRNSCESTKPVETSKCIKVGFFFKKIKNFNKKNKFKQKMKVKKNNKTHLTELF